MTVALPPLPRGSVVTPRLVRVGGDLVSVLGGPTQRITRIGSRYAVAIELPTLDPECAGLWLAAPLQAEASGETLTLVMPQMVPHAAEIVGAVGTGVAGSNLISYAGAAPKAGMWFSFAAGGRNYLHLVTAVVSPTQLAISPALRVPMSGTAMNFATPKLEGFCDDTAWSLEWFKFVGHSFTLTESA